MEGNFRYIRFGRQRIKYNMLLFFIAAYIFVFEPTIIKPEYYNHVISTLIMMIFVDSKPIKKTVDYIISNKNILIFSKLNKKYLIYTTRIFEYDNSMVNTDTEDVIAFQIKDAIIFNKYHYKYGIKIRNKIKKLTNKQIFEYDMETFEKIIKKDPKESKEMFALLI